MISIKHEYELYNGKIYRTSREEVTNEELVNLLNQNNEPNKLRLEPYNKNIDSTGWKSQTTYEYINLEKRKVTELVNPEGDIWELDGEQYFTFNAMEREAKKYGWHIPTDAEWNEIIGITPIDEFIRKNNFKPSGYHSTSGNYYNRADDTYLWSSTQVDASSAWPRNLSFSVPSVYRNSNAKALGFSLRCVQG